jgi:hypothetical protein
MWVGVGLCGVWLDKELVLQLGKLLHRIRVEFPPQVLVLGSKSFDSLLFVAICLKQ